MVGDASTTGLRTEVTDTVTTSKHRLIVLDDSLDWGNFISEAAAKVGYDADAVTSHRGYAEISKVEPPDLLVLDIFMPDKDGIEMILGMEFLDERPLILLISGQSETFLESVAKFGRSKGLDIIGTLAKPFRLPELKKILKKAAELIEKKKCSGAKNPCRAFHARDQGKASRHVDISRTQGNT